MSNSYLAIGYDCNHNCICCPLTTYDRLHKRIELEDIKQRIDLIPMSKNNHIVLSGGEPMIHPDFFDILNYLTDKHFSITILSNSSKCRDSEFAKRLAGYKHLDVITAIHSCTPKLHDEMTGTAGSLLETLEGLDHLVENGVPITIKYIFNAKTLPTLMNTFEYLEKHFPPQVGFQFCTMDYSGRAGKNKDVLFVSRDAITDSLENVLDFLESKMSKVRKISVIETPYCFGDPYYWKYFEGSGGKISTYIAPNTDEAKITYEIESDCNTRYNSCKKCAVHDYCPGIWKSAYAIDHTMLQPITAYE